MKRFRVLTAALFAAVLLCGFSATAYAGGGEEFMDGTGGYDPDPPVAEEPEPKPNPFTPEGTGTVVDNATDEDGKEFFTITTPNENIFYLVIDRQRSGENVYFLNAVSILKAVMLENGRGFALGEHPTAPSPYVTWACYDDKNGQRQYEWGHYGNDLAAMEQDFSDRVQDYQRLYHVEIVQTEGPGLYKYYSTQRPVDIGTFPKPPHNAPDEIVNYDQRIPVESGAFLAWGHLTYTRPLTERQAADYELRPAPGNPDRPRPIAQQMKEAAKLAGADRGDPVHKKKAPAREER